jgi:hypothetical protein
MMVTYRLIIARLSIFENRAVLTKVGVDRGGVGGGEEIRLHYCGLVRSLPAALYCKFIHSYSCELKDSSNTVTYLSKYLRYITN